MNLKTYLTNQFNASKNLGSKLHKKIFHLLISHNRNKSVKFFLNQINVLIFLKAKKSLYILNKLKFFSNFYKIIDWINFKLLKIKLNIQFI